VASQTIVIRRATVEDSGTIAAHRVGMFRDMGHLPDDLAPQVFELTEAYLRAAMPRGEYVAWLAFAGDDDTAIAGAGVQVRRILPRPLTPAGEHRVALAREAIILNVFTEQSWRRQGIAERLMQQVVDWARQSQIDRLVLHASEDGRKLYERMGFVPTNEMRYTRPLR
jgi:GNAT superfamily N-acetyltransferase